MSSQRSVSKSLIRWYDKRQRDLPWRQRADAYGIWVSEVMLQQTRVEVVSPYYERFLKRFPTVQALAAAPVEEVLALWSGLGYYRRARMMHQAAKQIAERGGEFPRTIEGLLQLPGIGRYTAAAVGSIAFGLVEPSIDGNVTRVVGRLLAYDKDTERVAPEIEEYARGILDSARPGDSNQALMDLGATVCLPRQPRCPICPLSSFCRGLAGGQPAALPSKRTRGKAVRVSWLVAVARDGEKLLLFKRPDDSNLLAGIWELPWVDTSGMLSPSRRLSERYGGDWRVGTSRGRVRHAITYRSIDVDVREARVEGHPTQFSSYHEAAWLEEEKVMTLPQSSLLRKVLATLGA